MDLFSLIRVVLSQWRLVVPIAVVTFGVAFYVEASAPPVYEANGYLLLDAPEATGDTTSSAAIDLPGLASGIELEGGAPDRTFTVSSMGGTNYSVAVAAPSAAEAEQDVDAVVDALAQRIRTIQDDADVPDSGRLDLSLVDPRIVAEQQADGSFLATVSVFLNDPAASGENPYPATSYTGRLLQVAVMGDSGLARFNALTGGDVTLVVEQEARDAAPLLQVVTSGPDPQKVIDGFFHTRDIIQEDLVARQDRAELLPRQRTTVGVVDAPLGVVDESPPLERLTAVVVALGGLFALAVALVLDAWERRVGPVGTLRDLMTPDTDVTSPNGSVQPDHRRSVSLSEPPRRSTTHAGR